MALIKCPDCGKMFSEFAESCPVCGCPTEDAKAELISHEEKEVEATKPTPSIEDSPVNDNMTNLNNIGEGFSRWKNYIIIGLVVIGGVLFLYHQCSKHKPSKPLASDVDTTVTKQYSDDQEQVTKERPTYYSKDLATFELYGKVESVTYNTDSPIYIYFDEFGDVCNMKKYWGGDKSNFSNGIIKRSAEEQIVEIKWDGDGWYSEFRYSYNNADGTYSENVANFIWTNGVGNRTEYCLDYNEEGQLEEISSVGYIHGEMVGTDKTKVELKKTDTKGNWIKRTCAIEDDIKVITRTIVYYE